MSKLYIVGTPIGNLEDITLRALRVLKEVDVIASEDTRHTRILLDRYDIRKPLISYYKQKENEGSDKICDLIAEGKNVALVTDAGMPAISDPGAVLVRKVREKGLEAEVVPGPTAVCSAVALAGLTGRGFCFLGFLPEKKKDRDRLLDSVKDIDVPLAFYVAPHDMESTTAYLYEKLGRRRVYACKELTKLHETVYAGYLGELSIEDPRGEFVLITDEKDSPDTPDMAAMVAEVDELVADGTSKKDALKIIADKYSVSKNLLYNAYHLK